MNCDCVTANENTTTEKFQALSSTFSSNCVVQSGHSNISQMSPTKSSPSIEQHLVRETEKEHKKCISSCVDTPVNINFHQNRISLPHLQNDTESKDICNYSPLLGKSYTSEKEMDIHKSSIDSSAKAGERESSKGQLAKPGTDSSIKDDANSSKEIRVKQVFQEKNEAHSDERGCQEQLQALLDVLGLVSQLAAMDTNHYQFCYPQGTVSSSKTKDVITKDENSEYESSISRFKGKSKSLGNIESFVNSLHNDIQTPRSVNSQNRKKINQDHGTHHYTQLEKQRSIFLNDKDMPHSYLQQNGDNKNHDVASIQAQIDNLQKQWKFEETPIPSLLASIHRLQSNSTHLKSEADINVSEIQNLHKKIVSYKSRSHELEKAVKKLYKKNKQMAEWISVKKQKRKSFVKTVKDYVIRKREEELANEQIHVATRLTIHESLLKMGSDNSAASSTNVGQTSVQGHCNCSNDNIPVNISDNNLINKRQNIQSQVQCDGFFLSSPLENTEHVQNINASDGNRGRTSTYDSAYSELDQSFEQDDMGSYRNYNYDFEGMPTEEYEEKNMLDDGLNGHVYKQHLGKGLCEEYEEDSSFRTADLVRLVQSQGSSSKCGGNSGRSSSSINLKNMHGDSDYGSCASSVSSSSTRSVVTDVCDATLRIDTYTEGVTQSTLGNGDELRAHQQSSPWNIEGITLGSKNKLLPTYTLTFPIGTKIGLQFQKVPIPAKHSYNGSTCARIEENFAEVIKTRRNRNRSFSDSAVLDNYRNEITVDSFAIDRATSPNGHGKSDIAPISATKACMGRPSKPIIFKHDDSTHDHLGLEVNKSVQKAMEDKEPEHAFLVCGFTGFDTNINVRPTVGARLIAVDGESLEKGKWTLEGVEATIQIKATNLSPCRSAPASFSLTFRNDPLIKSQKEILNKAIAAAEETEKINGTQEANDDLLKEKNASPTFLSSLSPKKIIRSPNKTIAETGKLPMIVGQRKNSTSSIFDKLKGNTFNSDSNKNYSDKGKQQSFFSLGSSKIKLTQNEELSHDAAIKTLVQEKCDQKAKEETSSFFKFGLSKTKKAHEACKDVEDSTETPSNLLSCGDCDEDSSNIKPAKNATSLNMTLKPCGASKMISCEDSDNQLANIKPEKDSTSLDVKTDKTSITSKGVEPETKSTKRGANAMQAMGIKFITLF